MDNEETKAEAENGFDYAQFKLGEMYSFGSGGVPQDYVEAVKWYRKAAEQNDAEAQCSLGICYATGRCVAQDEVEAVKWWRKAAEQNDATAQCNLGICYANGGAVVKNEVEAVKWWRKAAEQNYAPAQCSLGLCYAYGQGVAKDAVEAVKWYRKAAAQGNVNAEKAIGILTKDEENESNNIKIDLGLSLGLSIDGKNFPKVGQIIDLKAIDEAGLIKPGFWGRLMFSKLKTTPNDEIYWKKNCFIKCKRFDSYERSGFGITANTEVGHGDMWGNTIAVFISPDGFIKKVFFQIIMNEGIAEIYLQQFRRLCTKAFGTPRVATEEVHIWEDGETSIRSARNGTDAVFEWWLI